MDIKIRREEIKDFQAVESMTRDAFYNLYFPGCDEHYLAHTMRNHPDFIADLDYVAELDGRIVGMIMYTRSWLDRADGATLEIASFGPVCVAPDVQRMGIGKALIRHTLGLAKDSGIKAVAIMGDPHNYCVHGFRNGKDLGICDGDGRYPIGMLALELEKGALGGSSWKYRYSDAYRFDHEAAAAYDGSLPPKEKAVKPSQEIFSMLIRAFLD